MSYTLDLQSENDISVYLFPKMKATIHIHVTQSQLNMYSATKSFFVYSNDEYWKKFVSRKTKNIYIYKIKYMKNINKLYFKTGVL